MVRWFVALGTVHYSTKSPRNRFPVFGWDLDFQSRLLLPGVDLLEPRAEVTVDGSLLFTTKDPAGIEALFRHLDPGERLPLPQGNCILLKNAPIIEIPPCPHLCFEPNTTLILCDRGWGYPWYEGFSVCYLSLRQRDLSSLCRVADRLEIIDFKLRRGSLVHGNLPTVRHFYFVPLQPVRGRRT